MSLNRRIGVPVLFVTLLAAGIVIKHTSAVGVPVPAAPRPVVRAVQAPSPLYDSATRRDFASPHAAVAEGGTLAGSWTDQAGGVYSVSGGSLKATSADTTGYLRGLALRPPGEEAATPDVEGTIFVPDGLPTPGTANGLVLRFQPGGTFYLFQLSPDTLYVYKVVGGRAATRLGSVGVRPQAADAYSLTGSAVNAAVGVTLNVSALDTRTGKPIGSLRVSDDSAPITQAGRGGIDAWVGDNAAGTMTASYSRVVFRGLPAGARPVSLAFPKIGFIGDSITAGYNQVGSTITPGTNDAASLTVKKLAQMRGGALTDDGVPWSEYDRGSSGASTESWLPGSPDSLEGRAKSAFTAAFGKPDPRTNPVWVLLMLGTNDVRSDNRFTAERHRKNLSAVVEDLVAGGYNVVIDRAPSFVTPTRFNGVTWDAGALALLRSYFPEERAVAASFAGRAPGRVFLGDTSAFDYFAARPALFQEYGVYGGLHPNGRGGTDALAACWARAFIRINPARQPGNKKRPRLQH